MSKLNENYKDKDLVNEEDPDEIENINAILKLGSTKLRAQLA